MTDCWESRATVSILWTWKTSSAWQNKGTNQRLDNVLIQGVSIPPELGRDLAELVDPCDDIGEHAMESATMTELRSAAARAIIRKDEAAAIQLIHQLLDGNEDLVDVLTDLGCPLLNLAASSGLRSITQLLLEKGAAVDGPDTCGYAPLHCAARRPNIDIVRDLLAAQADPHQTSRTGCTPSTMAQIYGAPKHHDAFRKALRDYGFEEGESDKRRWDKRRRKDSNEKQWQTDADVEYMPMV